MNNFSTTSPIFILLLIVLGYLTFNIIMSSNIVDNYNHFNTFFCSGWAGECVINNSK